MSKLLIVVKDIRGRLSLNNFRFSEDSEVSILSLLNDEERLREVSATLEKRGIKRFEILYADKYINEASARTRDRYVAFVGEWPCKFQQAGRNFKESFSWDNNRLSLWWLTTFAMKNPFKQNIFNRLCHLQIIADILKSGKFKRCIVLTSDRVFSDMVRQSSESDNIIFTRISSCLPGFSIRDTVLWSILSRARFLVEISVTKLVLSFVDIFSNKRNELEDKRECAIFMTLYTYGLNVSRGILEDRFYCRLPEALENSQRDMKSIFMSYLYGGYFSSLRLLVHLLRRPAMRDSGKVVFLERYLGWSDIFRVFFDFRAAARYLLLEFYPAFRRSFDYDGVNIFGLLRYELRDSFLGSCIGRCLLTAKGYERFILKENVNVKFTFSFLEFYNVSRALYYVTRRLFKRTKTIAYQHALILPTDTSYYFAPSEVDFSPGNTDFVNKSPLPDYLILQGRFAREIVTSWGYPVERCFVTGSPRYDFLAEALARCKNSSTGLIRNSAGFPPDKKIAIVATSHLKDESHRIIDIVLKAVSKRKDIFLIFKPHPVCPIEGFVRDIARCYGTKNYKIVNDDIHNLISIGDVCISTYSTVTAEAFVFGVPVICLCLESQGVLDIFFHINSSGVARIKTSGELNNSLDILFSGRGFDKNHNGGRTDMIEGIFYRIDGNATDRICHIVEEMDT